MQYKHDMENLKKLAQNHNIDEIYLTGFMDIEDGEAEFYPDFRCIYFEINSGYIEFESVCNFSKLRLRIVDFVQYKFEVDEDMMPAKSKVGDMILRDSMANGNDINEIIFYNLDESDELICDAAEIRLVNGQVLFLDPSYYWGINLGGADGLEQREIWKMNLREPENVHEMSLKISADSMESEKNGRKIL